MDKLKEFIAQHRQEFDDRNPDPGLWDQIASRLPEPRRRERQLVMWKRIAMAAVVLALVMCGVVAGMYMGTNALDSNPAYAEFKQARQYYNMEFEKKKAQLANFKYDPQVDADLAELDSMQSALNAEFAKANSQSRPELINAMIQVYRTRIDLLERVLTQVEHSQSESATQEDEIIKI